MRWSLNWNARGSDDHLSYAWATALQAQYSAPPEDLKTRSGALSGCPDRVTGKWLHRVSSRRCLRADGRKRTGAAAHSGNRVR